MEEYKLSSYFKYDDSLKRAIEKVYPGSEYFSFLRALRSPGKTITLRVNSLKVKTEELVESLKKRGLKVYTHSILEEAILLPILGPYPLLETESLKKVYVDKRAAESVYQGANLYAPGVVSVEGNVRVGDKVVILSPRGEPVATGIAKMSSSEMLSSTKGLAVETVASRYLAPKIRELPEYKLGLFYEQSIPSIIVGREVDPKPGEAIVDMCAAPGGKTSHILQLSKLKVKLYAFDNSKSRIEKMLRELSRMDMLHGNVLVKRADSRYLDLDMPNLKADKVVLDPPCSSLGVRPKLYDSKSYDHVKALSNYQKQFLKVAWKVLKPNGVLVYSTCTVTIEENEEVILYAIEELGFELGELKYKSLGLKPLNLKLEGGAVRFHPQTHGTPGYFIAKLVKP